MHLMNQKDREDLGLNKLPQEVRDYIAALETEYERVTSRQKRLRDNIRHMQAKLETVNLRNELAPIAGGAAAQSKRVYEAMRRAV
jgi:cell division septum initiation protein DivIVA